MEKKSKFRYRWASRTRNHLALSDGAQTLKFNPTKCRRQSSRTLRAHSLALSFCLWFLYPQSTPSQQPRMRPLDVVKEYCRLDFDGARLSTETWKNVQPLVAWTGEPGWDTVTVVSGFQVEETQQSPRMAMVTATFKVLGTLAGDGLTVGKRKPEVVEFELRHINGAWKISKPVIMPHVSVASASKNIQHLIALEPKGADRKHNLESLLQQLQAAQEHTP